jgi:hypothetical protein
MMWTIDFVPRATIIDDVVEELPAPRREYGLQVDTPPLPASRK